MDYANYAEIYDIEHIDYTEDVRFFVRESKKARPPVLELGCGTGRVLLEVARAGVPIWGLDSCPAMLERCQQRLDDMPSEIQQQVHLVQGSMTDFSLDQKFGLIYLPFREFMHLMTVAAQIEALDCMFSHLRPDGRLIINMYDIDLACLRDGPDMDPGIFRQKHHDFTDPETHRNVLVSATSTYDAIPQILYEERIYETLDEQGRVVDKRYVFLSQRWYYRWEMHHLLERVGFKVVALYSNFRKEAYKELGSDMIWVARRPNLEELQERAAKIQEQIAELHQEPSE